MSSIEAVRAEHRARLDTALAALGAIAGGAPFTLDVYPDAATLDAAVAADSSWAETLLYLSITEYLEKLVENLANLNANARSSLAQATPSRVIRFAIDAKRGGLFTGASDFAHGRFDLYFRAQSLRTSQSGWMDIGHDVAEALAKVGSAPALPAPDVDISAPKTDIPASTTSDAPGAASALQSHLEALGAFVGDGVAWRVELADTAEAMDAAVTREASYMQGELHNTIETFLGFVVENVRRYVKAADLAFAASERVILFEFVDEDELPRPFLGAFQAVTEGDKLHFIGPAGAFKPNGGNVSDIGRDIEHAVMSLRGDVGPTERERKLAASLTALASSESTPRAASGQKCRMCKGTGLSTCNGCHGKGGSCTRCKGSGRSQAKCPSCKGAGER